MDYYYSELRSQCWDSALEMPLPLWEARTAPKSADRLVEISCCAEQPHPEGNLILNNTTPPESRLWPVREDKRRATFINLVERWYGQIRHGCENQYCKTATCHTTRARRKIPPYRRPTSTTARALAVEFASKDTPYRGLCEYLPERPENSSDLAFPTMHHMQTKAQALTMKDIPAETCMDKFLLQSLSSHQLINMTTEEGHGTEQLHEKAIMQEVVSSDLKTKSPVNQDKKQEDPQVRIDSKSFVQVIFDTSTWKMARSIEAYGARYRLIHPLGLRSRDVREDFRNERSNPTVDPTENLRTVKDADILLRELAEEDVLSSQHVFKDKNLVISTCYKHRKVRSNSVLCRLTTYMVLLELDKTSLCCIEGYNRSDDATDLLTIMGRRTPISCESYVPGSTNEPDVGREYFTRSVVNVLSDPTALLKSFMSVGPASESPKIPIDIELMRFLFAHLCARKNDSDSVLSCLWDSAAAAYHHDEQAPGKEQLDSLQAAHIIDICLGALVSFVPLFLRKYASKSSTPHHLWACFRAVSESGLQALQYIQPTQSQNNVIDVLFAFEDERCLRLMRRVLRVCASWCYLDRKRISPDSPPFMEYVLRFLETHELHAKIVLRWAVAIFKQSWDNDPIFEWHSDFGCAIEFIRILYAHRSRLLLNHTEFQLQYLPQRLNMMTIPVQFMRYKPRRTHAHLLQFPWLFPRADILTSFRIINHSKMFESVRTSASLRLMIDRPPRGLSQLYRMTNRLDMATSDYLLLTIRRSHILDDALSQLWKRQRKELLRPLRIKMGMEVGEHGQDLGGVAQEFFRLALGEAMDPNYGLFADTDEYTRMSWFVPCSVAPAYQFFLVGVLAGLAVYNSVTLSVTFPLAFYRKLLGLPVTSLEHIKDGWPSLELGLRGLLDFEGDVEESLMRSYVFATESCGRTWSADMEKQPKDEPWPPKDLKPHSWSSQKESSTLNLSKAGDSGLYGHPYKLSSATEQTVMLENTAILENAGMVTNSNRKKYVTDYIFWLTDKSTRTQYEQFAAGFFSVVERKSLDLFSPETLKSLVEGYQEIDVDKLAGATTYEGGFARDEALIEDFWRILRNFSPARIRKLLEFVTASDRVPARGVQDITFVISKAESGDQRLPTSSTCFGRLYLPAYSNAKVMETRLVQAIEGTIGFGLA